MADIEELQQRITAALDRIGKGVATLEAPGPDLSNELHAARAEIKATNAALEDERTAYAQLEERLRSLKARHEERVSELEAQVSQAADVVAALDAQVQGLREANAALRENNAALRAANAEHLGDAALINDGMRGELDALRAERDAEATEARAVLEALEPLVRAAEDPGHPDRKEETA